MSKPDRSPTLPWATTVCLLVVFQSGCTSALTTAYLRDGMWGGADHSEHVAPDEPDTAATAADEPEAPEPDAVTERARREAALEEAMGRLSRLGALDPAVEAALVATLQRTQPEDWPIVVEEFAASLPAGGAAVVMTQAPAAEPTPAAEPPAPAEPAELAKPDEPDAEPAATVAGDPEPPAAAADPEPPVAATVPPAAPPLAVRRACFASAVRAWGDVDRFTADRFRPGQDVIVYVELDNLVAGESPAGHTTCIDTVLRLVDAAGSTLHTWNFDPLAETCAARRRDYFARYVIHLPESAPAGGGSVEVMVTDTLVGSTATASLPLEIAAAE